jgi:PRTRC genetic system protein A
MAPRYDRHYGWVDDGQQDLPYRTGGYNPDSNSYDPDWWKRDTRGYNAAPVKPELPLEKRIPIERMLMQTVSDFNGDILECEMPAGKLVQYLQHDGIYSAVDLSFARLVVKTTEDEWKGQYQIIKPSFRLKIPKLPGNMYAQILAFFRHYVIDKGITGVTEVMVQVYWDNETQEYFINIPNQEVTGGHINYDFNKQDPRTQKKSVTRVFDIHSHNTMDSFFSGTDDSDEKGKQFYGVIGRISKDSHTQNFRIGINGQYYNFQAEECIDFSTFQETGVTFPEGWKDNVHIPNHLKDELSQVEVVTYRWNKNNERVPVGLNTFEGGPETDPPFTVETGKSLFDYDGPYDLFKEEAKELLEDIEKPNQMRHLIKQIMKSSHALTAMETMAHIATLRRNKQQRGKR